jgi:hypothetical protein
MRLDILNVDLLNFYYLLGLENLELLRAII